MTFEDGIAYSRNVVAAKVALGLGKTTRTSSADPPRHVDPARLSAARPASTSPARSAGIVNDPAIKPWRQIDLANGAFGQGVAVTPIQLATAYAAMVNGGKLRPAPRRQGHRRRRRAEPRPRARSIDADAVRDARRDDEPRRRRGPVLSRPDADPGLRRRRQDRHGADLGPEGEQRPRRLEAQHLQLLVHRLHRPRGRPSRTSSSRSGSRRARRPSPSSASSRCR